ncbi:MAG: hypothetical protein ACTSXQ_06165 [Alphaproteobacteria bacterium]
MSKKTKEQAIDKFIEAHADIKGMLEKIQTFHEDHFNVASDNVKWPNVGDAEYYAKQLEHLLLSANLIKIEEAKYNDEY